ncbi:MAG: hypothetical protein GY845_16795 [Planctomycetes bacterium]|nr:hypothetical protein [Planctomycetota bacterium]
MFNPYAYCDSLSIINHLQEQLDSVAIAEVHLFSYLACLLSLYKGQSVSEWGYDFAITRYAYPYSPALNESIDLLIATGKIVDDEHYLRSLEAGRKQHELLLTLSTNSEREPFIKGACASALAWSVGSIHSVLFQKADGNAIALKQSRALLTESGLETLYEQFAMLSSAIGVEVENLMVPAVVWLTYLSEIRTDHLQEQQNGIS